MHATEVNAIKIQKHELKNMAKMKKSGHGNRYIEIAKMWLVLFNPENEEMSVKIIVFLYFIPSK